MSSPKIILHLDQSRSGGHLFQRILSGQPGRHHLDHPFSQARGKQVNWLVGNGEDYASGMSDELRTQFDEEIGKGLAAWEEGMKTVVQSGGFLMIQDHCFNSAPPETVIRILSLIEKGELGPDSGENVVSLPENLLLQPSLTPIFTIRDPRLAVPSAYRVLNKFGLEHAGGRPMLSVSSNPIWIRLMYNWLVAHGVSPIVVDCDDVQTAGQTDFMQRLSKRLGLDPDAIRLSWPKIDSEQRRATHPSFYASQSTLLESAGVDPGLAARNRDLEEEEAGWEKEFGEDVEMVRRMVGEAEVHYSWLAERRFR